MNWWCVDFCTGPYPPQAVAGALPWQLPKTPFSGPDGQVSAKPTLRPLKGFANDTALGR